MPRDIQIMLRTTPQEADAIDAYAERNGSSRARASLDLVLIGMALADVRTRATGEQLAWIDRLYVSAGVLPR